MRYITEENPYIIARFTTGDTVKITVYKLSDNSKTVDDVGMTEIGVTGYFKYLFNPSPAALTEYLYITNNTIEEHAGKIILGGYPDDVKDQTDKMRFSGDDVKATLDSEEVTTDAASRTASKATGFATQNPPSLNLNDYKADVSNLDVAVSTRNATTPPTTTAIKNELEGVGTKLTAVKGQTDKLQFAVGGDIKATLDGEEVTTDVASRNASKADVSNLDVAVSTRSSHADPTNAIKGAPGKTIQEAYDNERGTEGANTVTPPSVAEIRAEIEGAGTKLTDVKEQTDKMNFIGDDIKATLDGEAVTLDAITEGQLDTIEEGVKRTLGLVHENIYIDLPGYDTNKNLVSARLRTYSVPGSVGTANDIIATYTITAVGAGKGKFTSWKMVKQ